MKTIEQILEGVTAGGKWRRRPFGFEVQVDNGEEMAPVIMSTQNPADAAYAARAARNFPALVRALKAIYQDTGEYIELNNLGDPHHNQSMKDARAVLAEALKD